MNNTKGRSVNDTRGSRRGIWRVTLLTVAAFAIGLLALTAVQFMGTSGWSKDVEATSQGMAVRLQFKAEQSEEGTTLLARVRDSAGFLTRVDSVAFVLTSQGKQVLGPTVAEQRGVFSSTGDGQYVADIGRLDQGTYEATMNVEHGQASFTATWPFEVE